MTMTVRFYHMAHHIDDLGHPRILLKRRGTWQQKNRPKKMLDTHGFSSKMCTASKVVILTSCDDFAGIRSLSICFERIRAGDNFRALWLEYV
jgi:hypothetical protein